MKTLIASCLLALSAALPLPALHAGEVADHRVAVHIDENDPARMNLVLNNVANVRSFYDGKGETVEIEVVAYGPGLHMLREDTSPVRERVAAMSLEIDGLTFAACGNTRAAMSRQAGAEVELVEEAVVVPSGVVRLIELQEDGYAYVRP